jgi:hypothetical protein
MIHFIQFALQLSNRKIFGKFASQNQNVLDFRYFIWFPLNQSRGLITKQIQIWFLCNATGIRFDIFYIGFGGDHCAVGLFGHG